MTLRNFDTIIIGAGAAGLMCGAVAGQHGRKVLILDHAKAVGEKIRISGGGRCNFTNLHCGPENFISNNPHFCKSALAGYTPQDFIDLLAKHKIAWHEKTLGQLFCDERAAKIIAMLLAECAKGDVETSLQTHIGQVSTTKDGFLLVTDRGNFTSSSLVVACGGPSIPKMGASGYGYQLAKQFGLKLVPPTAALVPFTISDGLLSTLKPLAGVSVDVLVHCGSTCFEEAMLFTHRGLSGPAILQISSYWSPGAAITINLAPKINILAELELAKTTHPKQSPAGFLSQFLPKRLAQTIADTCSHQRLADMNKAALLALATAVNAWVITPSGSEGFRTAEVTKGGVDTDELSSKSMAVKSVPGLYFIGEVVDVTGHLGGHNFQWAWASGVACGRALRLKTN
ncbi:MAG: NAD(P)/FAD-dependent oxidoreductase [Robiginitomaculum sp.]|nr:NAD(P)/FAD-dependent oxidoreductase [Robiginitomaculum sp.]